MSPDSTTNPRLRSFVPVPADSHFPIQNLPFGVFAPRPDESPRVGVAIGEEVLDLSVLEERGLVGGGEIPPGTFARSTLNEFMAVGRKVWRETRSRVSELLREDNERLRDDTALRARALLPAADVTMLLPAAIGDYTDFYSSREHATNVGTMFRGPENALMPNWLHLPVAYHGRSSSVVPSGTPIVRPQGQTKPDDAAAPTFGPTRLLDFELEMGFFIGPGSRLGDRIDLGKSEEHIFGMVLVNDWSARDIQKWEYQPLGPFLSKSFATSISPWVVTLEALAPFRCAGPAQDPEPLDYLRGSGESAFDIQLDVLLATSSMQEPQRIARSNFRYLYWSMAQQLAHHTVNGCNVRPGDLMASGTISGPETASRGSLLEITWRGSEPIQLPGGETRTFLQDGDRLDLRGWAQGDGYRVGFGSVSGRIEPAR